jgi:hypothetical protein
MVPSNVFAIANLASGASPRATEVDAWPRSSTDSRSGEQSRRTFEPDGSSWVGASLDARRTDARTAAWSSRSPRLIGADRALCFEDGPDGDDGDDHGEGEDRPRQTTDRGGLPRRVPPGQFVQVVVDPHDGIHGLLVVTPDQFVIAEPPQVFQGKSTSYRSLLRREGQSDCCEGSAGPQVKHCPDPPDHLRPLLSSSKSAI